MSLILLGLIVLISVRYGCSLYLAIYKINVQFKKLILESTSPSFPMPNLFHRFFLHFLFRIFSKKSFKSAFSQLQAIMMKANKGFQTVSRHNFCHMPTTSIFVFFQSVLSSLKWLSQKHFTWNANTTTCYLSNAPVKGIFT